MIATNIRWDYGGYEETILPTEIEIPSEIKDKEEISDYISDLTGFCHFGFDLEE